MPIITLDFLLLLLAAILALLAAFGVPAGTRVHLGWLAFALFIIVQLTP